MGRAYKVGAKGESFGGAEAPKGEERSYHSKGVTKGDSVAAEKGAKVAKLGASKVAKGESDAP